MKKFNIKKHYNNFIKQYYAKIINYNYGNYTKYDYREIFILAIIVLFSYIIYLSDRKSTRLNSSHVVISYAVFCLKKKNNI